MGSHLHFKEDTAGITDVPGFTVGAAACDIRQNGDDDRLDMAVIHSERPCSAAGVFTQSDLKAAPVRLCRVFLNHKGIYHGIVANSGNANACTGSQGMMDALEMSEVAEKALDCASGSIFVCSTGRIGRTLPMDNVRKGILHAIETRGRDDAHGRTGATAILTSDTRAKTATAHFDWNGKTVTVAGMAKGAGMIQPDMATMLCFIATDATCSSEQLGILLKQANSQTFNRITVDGDMSTNDTVLILANGQSGVSIDGPGELSELFGEAVRRICESLARKIVGDGERITKIVEVEVKGAPSHADADKAARAVGNSLLVKTSWFGNDPNWGRIAHAVGYARVGMSEDLIDIFYDNVPALLHGKAQEDRLPEWKDVVSRDAFKVTVDMNLGDASATIYSTDLTTGYIEFNKSE